MKTLNIIGLTIGLGMLAAGWWAPAMVVVALNAYQVATDSQDVEEDKGDE